MGWLRWTLSAVRSDRFCLSSFWLYQEESGRDIEVLVDSGACLSNIAMRESLRAAEVVIGMLDMSLIKSGIHILCNLRMVRVLDGLLGLG